jgi:uncharacterized protein (TIGR04255 family)
MYHEAVGGIPAWGEGMVGWISAPERACLGKTDVEADKTIVLFFTYRYSEVPLMTEALPRFANPPVVEVALSIMVEPLASFKTAYVGLLWNEIREQFPKTADHPPLDSVIEREKEEPRQLGPSVQFAAVSTPQLRTWFLNEAETELLQVQHDRVARNWRRADTSIPYPSYGKIRGPFEAELKHIAGFVSRNGLGSLKPIQCEVTYVNHMKVGEGWQNHSEMANVFTNWKNTDGKFLLHPEDARFVSRYVIKDNGQFLGRLHVSVQPAFSIATSAPIFILTLTARGRPLTGDLAGALGFLDIGHEWIVRGFADLTTQSMHQIWRREI